MLDFMASWFTPTTLFCVLNLMIGIIFITSNLKSHHHKPPPSPSPDDEHHHHPLLRAPSILERVRSFNFSLYSSEQQPYNDPLHFSTLHLDPHQQPNYHPPQLVRAPSLLERVRSFNLSLYRSKQQSDTDLLQFSTHHLDPQQPDDEDEDEDEHNKKNNNPPQLVRAPSLLERVKSFNFSLYRSEQPDPVQHETHHVEEAHVTRRSKSDKTGEGPGPGPANMKKSASGKARAAVEEVDRRRPATMRERNAAAAAYGGEEEEVDAKADDFINRFKQQLKLQRLDSILRYRDMLNRGSGRILLLESFGVYRSFESLRYITGGIVRGEIASGCCREWWYDYY
ncbi:hypothetical protein ACSBR2_038350 [Camellia fascicularis]